MARTIDTIYKTLVAAKEAKAELAGLDSLSAVSIWRLLLYVVAVGIWALENIYDIHLAETKDLIAKQKKGSEQWYAEMAMLFQFGDTLVADQDYYDNTGIDPVVVAAKKVVAYSAAKDQGTGLRMKVARVVTGELAPLSAPQLSAFQAYMARVKFAGVFLSFVNNVADALKLSLTIYYDPLVLDATGQRLDGTNNTPVQEMIEDYLVSGISFNGYFVTSALVDKLKQIDGVKVPSVNIAQGRYGILPFSNIIDLYLPDAGYLRIAPADLTLTFVPSPI